MPKPLGQKTRPCYRPKHRASTVSHAQSAAGTTTPVEPFLHIVVALEVPVAPAFGTFGFGPGKHKAAEQAAEAESSRAQSESEAEVDIVAVHPVGAKPRAKTDDNACDRESREYPVAAGTVFDSLLFNTSDLCG